MYWRSSNFMQKIKRAWEENSEKSVLRIDWQTDGHELTGLCRNAGSTIFFHTEWKCYYVSQIKISCYPKLCSSAIWALEIFLENHHYYYRVVYLYGLVTFTWAIRIFRTSVYRTFLCNFIADYEQELTPWDTT